MSVRRWRRKTAIGSEASRWVVDIKYRHKDGSIERIRQFPRLQTKAAAERLERELFARLEEGRRAENRATDAPSAPPVTLDQFWGEFFSTHVIPNNKPSEQAAKLSAYRQHLQPVFGVQPLANISSRDIERYKAHKLTDLGYAPKSINNQLAVLRSLLNVAKRWQMIAEVPAYKELKVPPARTRFLSKADARRLIEAAETPWADMIGFCLNTGMRIGELIALQWSDIDMVATRLVVQRNAWREHLGPPKGGRVREIALNAAAMRALLSLMGKQSEWVFPQADGSRLTHAMCRRPLHRACRSAGVALLQWHTLRHTFASHLVATGVPLRAIQQLLGHANYATTERYAHLAPRTTRDAVDSLDFCG